MEKYNFSKVVANHSYYYLSIPFYGNWKDAKVLGPTPCVKPSDFQNMIVAEANDVVAREKIEKLKEDIQTLANLSYKNSCKAVRDVQQDVHPNKKQKLWWVFAEYICHVQKIGIRAGLTAYKDMYAGNCFESKKQAENFFNDIINLFAKYGIIITKINNQFA